MNDLFLTKDQLWNIRKTWQEFLAGHHPEDEMIILKILKYMEPSERVFIKRAYGVSGKQFKENLAISAEEVGIPLDYGWVLLRFAEGKFGLLKGWIGRE